MSIVYVMVRCCWRWLPPLLLLLLLPQLQSLLIPNSKPYWERAVNLFTFTVYTTSQHATVLHVAVKYSMVHGE
jgi:hypothetical protein